MEIQNIPSMDNFLDNEWDNFINDNYVSTSDLNDTAEIDEIPKATPIYISTKTMITILVQYMVSPFLVS